MMKPKQAPPYSKKAQELKIGFYRHFRGMRYEVIGISRHSETLEEYVVYRALYGNHDLWIRPLSMFTEEVVDETGKRVLRFQFISASPQ